jgi:hypothetical protein
MKKDELENIFRDKLIDYQSPHDSGKTWAAIAPLVIGSGSNRKPLFWWFWLSGIFLLLAVSFTIGHMHFIQDDEYSAFKFLSTTNYHENQTQSNTNIETFSSLSETDKTAGSQNVETNPENGTSDLNAVPASNKSVQPGTQSLLSASSTKQSISLKDQSAAQHAEANVELRDAFIPLIVESSLNPDALLADLPEAAALKLPAEEEVEAEPFSDIDLPNFKNITPIDLSISLLSVEQAALPDNESEGFSGLTISDQLSKELLASEPSSATSISALPFYRFYIDSYLAFSPQKTDVTIVPVKSSVNQHRVFLRGAVSTGFTGRSLSTDDPEALTYLNQRLESEAPLFFYGGNLMAGVMHTSGFYLLSGLSFTNIDERFEGRELRIEHDTIPDGVVHIFVNALNDTILTHGPLPVVHHIDVHRVAYNRLSMVDLPVIAGYRFNLSKLNLEMETGLFFNLRFDQLGYRYNEQGQFMELEGNSAFKNSSGVSIHGAFRANYQLGERAALGLALTGRYYPGSFLNDNSSIRENYWLHGLEFSFSRAF